MNASRACVAALLSFLALLPSPLYAENPPQAIGNEPPLAQPAPPPAPVAAPAPTSATGAPVSLLPAPAVAPQPAAAVALPPPVQATPLTDIDPESIGLLSPEQGGLGGNLWNHTKRATVVKLLTQIDLPTLSPSLNDLARRTLLTIAHAPEGISEPPSVVSLRVSKLLALGDAAGAWQLALLAKPEQMDETILRAVTENALLSDQGTQVCAKLPVLTKTYSAPEWQKVLFVSQLHDKDIKSAQVTLDLLRTQGVKDDLFYTLAERAVTGNTKQLPRQLTPLKPLNLALLRLMEAPLPTELYAHPDAALIAPLLQGKAVDDSARLQLAERGAAKGLVTSTDLAALYQSLSFTPDILAAPLTSHEQGGKLRALLFQAASKETDGVKKAAILKGFIDSLKPTDMNATLARVLTGLLDTITPTDDWNVLSGVFARLYVLDGSKPEGTRTWIKQAHHAEVGLPNVTADLRSIWALLALSGLETPAETAKNLEAWLSSTLAMAEDKTTRTKAATLLLLLDAQGLPVSDDQWALVSDTVTMEKKQIPSPVAFERLRLTGAGGKRGEVVLLSLLATQGGDEPALLTSLETIRALRLAGLIPEAAARAREVAQANDLLN